MHSCAVSNIELGSECVCMCVCLKLVRFVDPGVSIRADDPAMIRLSTKALLLQKEMRAVVSAVCRPLLRNCQVAGAWRAQASRAAGPSHALGPMWMGLPAALTDWGEAVEMLSQATIHDDHQKM